MALGDTVYVFDIGLANSDSNVYESLKVSVARHPSETPEHMLTRVLAYCLEYTEGIALSNGLSEPHEPAIAVRDLTGALKAWIDVGSPEALRLHRASKAAPRVAVYMHKDATQLAARLRGSGSIAYRRSNSTQWTSIGSQISRNGCNGERSSR